MRTYFRSPVFISVIKRFHSPIFYELKIDGAEVSMFARLFLLFPLVGSFALQGCGMTSCGKIDAARAHLHEASMPCEEAVEDFEPLNTFEFAGCVLIMDEVNTDSTPYCSDALVDKAKCLMEIDTCDPDDPQAFEAQKLSCDEVVGDRCPPGV